MLAELGENTTPILGAYLDVNREQPRCLSLRKRECLILVSG